MQEEIWKDVVGYEGYYQVSNLGRVRSVSHISKFMETSRRVKHGQIVKPYLTQYGYNVIRLHRNGIISCFFLHRVVAQAFIKNPENKPQIDHINTIRTDNRVENLRWCTNKENCNNPITRRKYIGRCKGRKHSEESKEKMRAKRIGKLNPFFGKHHSEEYKKSKSKKLVQLTLNGDFVREWDTSTEAGMRYCVCSKAIRLCCNGINKTCAGYKWMFKKDYDNRNTAKAERETAQ